MSTPGSSSSAPYRYSAQPQDSRIAPQYFPRQQNTTSTASAYAYAQQQQQNRLSYQSHPHSSTSTTTSTAYPYLPPQIQRHPPPQSRRAPSLLADRPHSIEELAKLAAHDKYNRFGDIKQDLRHAEIYLAEGKKDMDAGDLEWAFVNFARTATLVVSKIPTNNGYHEMRQIHRDALAGNGTYCVERMSEIKPKLVDRYEQWRQRNPNATPEFDMPRILSAMAARDQEELSIRAQEYREKRAASKEEAARRAYVEDERRRIEVSPRYPEPQHPSHDEDSRARQEEARKTADRKAFEEARWRQEETRKQAEERARAAADAEIASRRAVEKEMKNAELERRRREAEEEARRREDDIRRRKQQEAQRQEQEAASRRKAEELEYRRRMEESRRREQEGIAQRQREAEAEAQVSRSLMQTSMPIPAPPAVSVAPQISMPTPVPSVASSTTLYSPQPSGTSSSASSTLVSPLPTVSFSSSSSNSASSQGLTPRQDALPILPLESPTREESDDPRNGWHHPQPQHAVTERAFGRTNAYQPPITTTSPPPRGQPVIMQYPSLMTEHQRAQGYTPSLQSMFSLPISGPPPGGLLFRPNNPEGPSMKNLPSSPDRPPAHIRHMWEQAGYGYQYASTGSHGKSKPAPVPGDSRILRPEQVRDDAATVIGKELRIVKVTQNVLPRFLQVAAVNTARNKETCGLLMGRENGKEYKVTTLLIPKQRSTSDTCTMDEEELVSEFAEKRKLLTLGWIHTHPTQSCFMSSLDLHTHAAFQCTLPEFFAIVCAPKHVPDCGIFRLTDPPGLKTILKCPDKAAFHPHPEGPIYTDADKGHVVWVEDIVLEIVDLR